MYPYAVHMSGWGYALGIIGMVLFWAVLVLAIAAAVRYLDRKRRESFPPPAPPAVREKFALRAVREKQQFFAPGGHGACSGPDTRLLSRLRRKGPLVPRPGAETVTVPRPQAEAEVAGGQ
jgi:hypothetical protein